MSTDPYPEVGVDESGIPPGQSARSSEWPKKIRTLTASELDRLTIDGDGRFYWDGRLVSYGAPLGGEHQAGSPRAGGFTDADAREQSAMEIIDRAVHELAEHRTPEAIKEAELSGEASAAIHDEHQAGAAQIEDPAETVASPPHEARDPLDLDMSRPAPHHVTPSEGRSNLVPSMTYAVPAAIPTTAIPAMAVAEITRLRLSRWQAFGAIMAVLGILVGALGMAAYGFVAAHEWGCRTGLIKTHCPAPPDLPTSRRPDIPA